MKLLSLLAAAILVAPAVAAQTVAKPPPTTSQTNTAGAASVAARLQAQGYTGIHDLRRGPDGQWVGKASRNGAPVTVTLDPVGSSTAR